MYTRKNLQCEKYLSDQRISEMTQTLHEYSSAV